MDDKVTGDDEVTDSAAAEVKSVLFEKAMFYTASDDNETLSIESPWMAIQEVLESCQYDFECPALDEGGGAKVIEEVGSVEIFAFVPKTITVDWINLMAEGLAEHLADNFCTEYGSPDGDDVSEAELVEWGVRLREVIIDLMKDKTSFQCERVAARTYSVDEILSMAIEECPEWFADEPEE